jgi:putative N6-adenine-specific DNA methylase
MEHFFATCPRGLEQLLADDLTVAGASNIAPTFGGVAFSGEWPVCYSANLNSRIATRILWRVGKGYYRTEEDIYKIALDTPWPRLFTFEETLRVDVTAIKSPLQSLDFITLRIKDAVCDRMRREKGERPNIDTREPDVRVQGFLTVDQCTLYIDTSGAPLYQRGLRQKTVEAPLKENLAAGVLRLSGWQPGAPLLDPMCGSGTFLLEAAQIAHNIAAGSRRHFGFEKLRSFDAATWQAMQQAAIAAEKPVAFANIYGSDISPQATRAALANLDRAGLLGAVQLDNADLLDREVPERQEGETGYLVCNPPYGERLSEQDELAAFYPELGSTLKKRYAGWNCYFLSADTRLPKGLGLKPSRKTPLFNGALECRLYEIKMVSGSNRKEALQDNKPA